MLGMNEDLYMDSDLEARIAIIFGGRWRGSGGVVKDAKLTSDTASCSFYCLDT
jgi:hypothetical protein